MANTGVKGRVVFAGTDDGISGLTVNAYDIDPLSGDDFLGTATTVDGNFHIKYQPGNYRPWFLGAVGENPDIEVRIYGAGGRLLWETARINNVTDETRDLGKIEIHRNNVRVTDLRQGATSQERLDDPYWLATHTVLFPADGTPIRLTRGNALNWLIDGAAMFPEITKEIKAATSSVKLMNMAIDVDTVVTDFDFLGKDHKTVGPADPVNVMRLGRLLKHKATNTLAVNVLVWDLMDVGEFFNFLLNKLFSMDTADEVKTFFQGSNVRTDTLETSQLLHIKLVVVDGQIGFVIGSTMKQGYFGGDDHLLRDARHGGLLPATTGAGDQSHTARWRCGQSPDRHSFRYQRRHQPLGCTGLAEIRSGAGTERLAR